MYYEKSPRDARQHRCFQLENQCTMCNKIMMRFKKVPISEVSNGRLLKPKRSKLRKL